MTSPGYAAPDLLVETDWLEAHLDDPNIRIVDCEPFDAYRRAHIKNAVGLRVHPYIHDSNTRGVSSRFAHSPHRAIVVACVFVAQQREDEYSVRRTDAALSIGYDLFFRCGPHLLKHGSQLVGGPERLVWTVR